MATSAATQRKNPHVVLITFYDTGHILPNLMLAKQLALLGTSVTLIFPNKYSYSLLISSTSSTDVTQGLDIQLLALEVEGDDGLHPIKTPVEIMPGIRASPSPPTTPHLHEHTREQNALKEELEKMTASPSPPVAVIFDELLDWASAVIHKFEIPSYIFFTNASSHLAWRIHIADLYEQGKLPLKDEECPPDMILAPGLPQIPWQQMPPQHMTFPEKEAKGILLNSSQELERSAIDAIRMGIEGKIYIVGPLILLDNIADIENSTSTSTILPSSNESVCTKWLDGQSLKSVLYVSFGSRSALTDEQMMELAVALEQSKKPFLWVIPIKHVEDSSSYLTKVLPAEFCERTADTGLIIPGWAPQHLILGHQAIGGFLTHCGWNSTLECVCLAGVPMLCWPFNADQPVVCRYIVDELKIGVDVYGDKDGFVKHSEVLRAVMELMEGDKADAMRESAAKLRDVVRNTSAGYNGSSRLNLKAFVEDIKHFS